MVSLAMGLVFGLRLAAADPWQEGDGFRFRELDVPTEGHPGFTRLLGDTTGIRFANRIDRERGIDNRNLLSGSGIAAGDVNGDGWCDLYFCRIDGPNALYLNHGQWRFEDITERCGAACPDQDSTGAAFADIDGDGDVDLLVNSLGHGVRAFRNDGAGQFEEITEAAGLASQHGGMSLALADVDGDGDLDLYVVNYRTTTIMDQLKTTFRVSVDEGRPVVVSVNGIPTTHPDLTNRFVVGPTGRIIELAEPDGLYLNDGQGRFREVSFTDGSFLDEDGQPLPEPPYDWGLSAQFQDVNGDRAPDLYVCNDLFSPDRFWINDGQGRFRAIERVALRTTSTFSMGVDFGDLDRDGSVDFMVVDMLGTTHRDRHTQVSTEPPVEWPIGAIENRPQVWRNTLQRNRGDGTFAEVSFYAGVEASNWSWMPLFLDVDLDGFEDLLVPNGQLLDVQNVDMQNRIEQARATRELDSADIRRMVGMFPDFRTPNLLFRNHGDWTFTEMKGQWGFDDVGMSQGTITADLDQDGDLDVVCNNLNEEAGVYRNESPRPRVAVRLVGTAGNPSGVGAKVTLTGGPVPQSEEVIAGGHYLSSAEPLLVFAAGSPDAPLRLEVIWRDGRRSVVSEARPNRLYEIRQDTAPAARPPSPPEPTPLFTDVTERLGGQQHHDDPFDDFLRQPLLARRLSQLGPGVAWHDFDGDGWEDLVIGAGRGEVMGVLRNDGAGGFVALTSELVSRPVSRDQTTVLGLGSMLVVGSSNYEDGSTNGGCLRIFDLARGTSGDSILGESFSVGPLALADVDGDGMLDLFVGGRALPGRYPEPADSLLLRNQGGRLVPDQRFAGLGLVSGAAFTDLDGDGSPELAVACEWGPVRLFRRVDGRFVEITQAAGLADYRGWWTGINSGDFDGDGRLDLVAGNWGLNHPLRRASRDRPQVLLYGDLDESGTIQLVEARYSDEVGGEAPSRGYLAVVQAMPFIQGLIPTFEAYGTSTLDAIYGDALDRARRLEADTLTAMLFLNRGDRFEARPLPKEAQFSPAFGISIADLDGDGDEDLFLSQNFFATALDYPRCDAGRGLVLMGDGTGGLQAMPGQRSGVTVYGEQRGSALADFDHDGRTDLVVTQNGSLTRLFRNERARPGLRVKLLGTRGNPSGIGAVLRMGDANRLGPARELHAGAGYWSSDSPVAVLCFAGTPTRLWVRWPGGAAHEYPLAPGARQISVRPDGTSEIEGR